MPLVASRYYLGFPPEAGSTSGDYREGRETIGGTGATAPEKGRARDPRRLRRRRRRGGARRCARRSTRAGNAAIFSADASSGILPGGATAFDGGAGLTAVLRTSAPLDATPVRRGALDAALAWVRDPKPGPSSAAPPAALTTSPDKRFADTALPDEAHRVLAAFRIWGTIEYFSVQEPHARRLGRRASFGPFRSARRDHPARVRLALMKMYAHIHDTHGFVGRAGSSRGERRERRRSSRATLKAGPTIVRVDPAAAKRDGFARRRRDRGRRRRGRRRARRAPAPVRQRVHRAVGAGGTRRLSASSGCSPDRREQRHAAGARCGRPRARGAHHARRVATALRARTRPVVEVLAGNVGYVDLQRLDVAGVDAMFKQLASTRAIVFDLRGYPRGTAWRIAPHLTASTVSAALFRTPVSRTAHDAPNSTKRRRPLPRRDARFRSAHPACRAALCEAGRRRDRRARHQPVRAHGTLSRGGGARALRRRADDGRQRRRDVVLRAGRRAAHLHRPSRHASRRRAAPARRTDPRRARLADAARRARRRRRAARGRRARGAAA